MELKKQPLGEFEDRDGNVWSAALVTGEGEPKVHLRRKGSDRQDNYNLHQFLSVAGRVRDFNVNAIELGDIDYTIAAEVANRIAQDAMGRLSRRDGHYEIRWVPNDPRVPF